MSSRTSARNGSRSAVWPVVVGLLACAGDLRAQERIPLPAPDPAQPGTPIPPAAPFVQSAPLGAPFQAPPPAPFYRAPSPGPALQPAPFNPPPPPGDYGPPAPDYGPHPFVRGDPVHDPSSWFGIESLVWWSKNQPLAVPLITTGPASQGSNAGALGAPGTVSLNGPLEYGAQGGLRLYGGAWFDRDRTWGFDASGFFLGQRSAGFGATDRSGTGNLVLNEPLAGAPFSTLVSYPGVESGTVAVSSRTAFGGLDVNGLYNLTRGDGWNVNLLGGFRYLQLDESLGVVADSALFAPTTYTDNAGNALVTAPPGSSVRVVDRFSTRNSFYGGQFGARFRYVANRWYFGGSGTVALGSTHETVSVSGHTNVYPANADPVTLSGGNYASLQAGRYSADRFAVSPALQLNVGYQLTPFARAVVGYDFVYISNVARPGNQIDNAYDGAAHPLVPMANSSYWAQGVNLGFQFSY